MQQFSLSSISKNSNTDIVVKGKYPLCKHFYCSYRNAKMLFIIRFRKYYIHISSLLGKIFTINFIIEVNRYLNCYTSVSLLAYEFRMLFVNNKALARCMLHVRICVIHINMSVSDHLVGKKIKMFKMKFTLLLKK